MKAAVLNTCPGSLDIEDVHIGEPGPREVLVRTAAAGLCHSDLHFMEAKYPFPCPAVLGHESAGVVEAVGSMVTHVAPGDHVITCLSAFCGHCEQCLSGHMSRCDLKATELVRGADEAPRLSRGDGELDLVLPREPVALTRQDLAVKLEVDHECGSLARGVELQRARRQQRDSWAVQLWKEHGDE